MSKDVYILGIDIGTQGVKGALFNEAGACLAEHGEPSRLLHPEKDAITEDPEYQYQSVLKVIRKCIEKSGVKDTSQVAALSVDGQMAGVIGIGDDGRAVTPYDSWLDTRCASYVERMKAEAGELILKKAGTAPSFNHGPKKLWWMHERPEVFSLIRSFVQPGGYAAARVCGLSGKEAFIDKTYLHFSGFSDTRAGTWDDQLCSLFHMPEEKLPRIVGSTEIVGTVTREASEACGLQQGTPVAAGCGDTVASFLSSGAVEHGLCIDVAGTASVFSCTQKDFLPDVSSGILGCCASVMDGLWYSYAYINGGGMNPEWFADLFGSSKDSSRFRDLEEAASQVEDSLSLPLFIPHMAGRVMPSSPELRGSWAGMNWKHGKGELFRAVLEGVALEYGIYRDAALALCSDLSIREIRVTGGGEKSALWNVMKSGVLQAPVVRIKQNQGAPLGTAMVAAVAAGVFPSFRDASAAWVATGERITCSQDRWEYFSRRLERYRELMRVMESFCREFPFSASVD